MIVRTEVVGSNAHIILRKNNDTVEYCAVIDAEYLPKVLSADASWYICTHKNLMRVWGYFRGQEKYKYQLLYRFILELTPDDGLVDHINGNPLDNRKENLRVVNQRENMQNVHKMRSDNSTGVRGVSRARNGKYIVRLRIPNGPYKHYGTFGSLTEAHNEATRIKAETQPFSKEARAA